MSGQSLNNQEAVLELLRSKAPEIFTEGKIDTERLKLTLGENVETDEERYGLNWAGKTDCFKRIQETTTNTLKPCREESVDFDKTQNLFIEGDNLQVLKTLQRSYYGKVKMIYIDPPYNTGNDFVYNDAFGEVRKEYLKKAGAIDEDGNVLEDGLYRRNTKDGGHYHSNWLNMMYPRLFLARNLLRQDGVIFVSIDDNEVKNLRGIMDEIFGEENFVASIVWQKKQSPQNDSTYLSAMHDYVLVYAKRAKETRGDDAGWKMNLLTRSEEQTERYQNPDNDPRGVWTSVDMTSNKTASQRPNLYYSIKNPVTNSDVWPTKERVWRYSKDAMNELLTENRIFWGSDGNGFPRQKRYLSEVQAGVVPSTWWTRDFAGDNQAAKREIRNIFSKGEEVFDTPKPVSLIKRMLEIASDGDDIVLDFFAGSGTTAHAVMQLNAEDGGNRKWICVQLPEKCKEDSEAMKAGYITIAEVAMERIRRAGKTIEEEVAGHRGYYNGLRDAMDYKKREVGEIYAGDDGARYDFDFGFKVYKLDESNFKIWNMHVESQEQLEQQMMDFIDNVREDSTNENLLHELILKSGQELTTPIESKKIGKETYQRIGDGSLVICLDDINEKLFVSILADKPKKIVLLDRAFRGNDELKTNMLLKAEDESIEVMVI